MRRRQFVSLLGAAASVAAWPFAARGQALPVIGYIGAESHDLGGRRVRGFHRGLGEAGFVEGRNVAIEYRWIDGRPEQLPAMVADLVRRPVTVIASLAGVPSARAVKAATTTIPVVFQGGFDPVELGIVPSLSRPGGNLTGVSSMSVELGAKRLELVHELVPAAKVVALAVNPTNPNAEIQVKAIQAAAQKLGLQIRVLHVRTERDFDAVFAGIAKAGAGALVIANNAPFNGRADQIGALSARHAVPAIFQAPEFTAAGGLVSYGTSSVEAYRLTGVYTGRVLKGEKPADLPVQQVSKVELIINLKTAKTLGINVPLPLLGRADEVIE
jgi:putative tryptophan/tyrosine transport system substrate-binding protein